MSTAEQNEQDHQQSQQQSNSQQQQQENSVQQHQHHEPTTNTAPEDDYDNSNAEAINNARNLNANQGTADAAASSPPPPPQYYGIVNGLMPQQEISGEQNEIAGLGLTLMQSSPPPQSYRHSRAYRHFKNPPQPHMCIRTTTETGEELFINVLSWTRIVIPQEPSDPIPLYGGMRVPPGSPRSPPIVFAVMANPEVLKDSGRHSKDAEERRAMVELMCDFVEAMNPGVKLVRNAIILKDRDISGELKDVWNAVQAQRDREREEQMLAQRQQQHYQNITTQQMFPKSPDPSAARTAAAAVTVTGNTTISPSTATFVDSSQALNNGSQIALEVFAQQLDNKVASEQLSQPLERNDSGSETTIDQISMATVYTDCIDQTDASSINLKNAISTPSDNQQNNSSKPADTPTTPNKNSKLETMAANVLNATNTVETKSPSSNSTASATNTANSAAPTGNSNSNGTTPSNNVPPPKKEKLGGFLPNGCIFPRFKNNKNKDKDKDKDSQKETKSKEKTLLNALKKNKDKKVSPIEQTANNEKSTNSNNTTTHADASQYEKNCINNLESGMQKLDLNKIETSANNDMYIKLKVAAANATATAAAAK